MRARALFAGTVGALLLAVVSPAAAKVGILDVQISGPGVGGGGLRISGATTEGIWDSGIYWAGGLDDTSSGSASQLGLTADELGPRYVVTYRLDAGTETAEIVRQELYPYAKGGPVTYTPQGQHIAEGLPWEGAISADWYQSSIDFFHYLVDQGLPESDPVVDAERGSNPDTVPAASPTPWSWLALALVGLVAVSVVAARLRRRILSATRARSVEA